MKRERGLQGHWRRCLAIVDEALPLGRDAVDRHDVWSKYAEDAEQQMYVGLDRVINAKLNCTFPTHQNLWICSGEFEERKDDSQSMQNVLTTAVENCACIEVL